MIPMTCVCRYWRKSIVSTPENWASISSQSKRLAELSFQRAKATPLDIRLDMAQINKTPGFSDLLAPHVQNTEILRIDSSASTQELAQTLPNFPQSMPNLRSLSLAGRVCFNRDWSTDPFGPLTTLTHLSLIYVPLYPSFLHLRTLTHLTLDYSRFELHLDTLLDFLEENRSLERADLDMGFPKPVLGSSRRRVPVRNRIQSLTITCPYAVEASVLVSSITLQRGAHLEISLHQWDLRLNDITPIISTAHLQSPTVVEYDRRLHTIRLLGQNGSFSFFTFGPEGPFAGLPPAHFTNVREFRYNWSASGPRSLESPPGFPPPNLPALETLVTKYGPNLSHLFSTLFSDPSSSPSLKILAFLDCTLGEDFMEELTRFASNRKNSTSAWLYRVVIINSQGIFPRFASIVALREHVLVVDVQIGDDLPAGLV